MLPTVFNSSFDELKSSSSVVLLSIRATPLSEQICGVTLVTLLLFLCGFAELCCATSFQDFFSASASLAFGDSLLGPVLDDVEEVTSVQNEQSCRLFSPVSGFL